MSWWPGSRGLRAVAGWRARIAIGRLAGVGGDLAAAGLALRPWRGALLPDGDAQSLHPTRIGVQHFHLEIAGAGNDLATHRQPADMTDQIAAQRLDLFAGLAGDEFLADHRADVVEARAGIGDEGIVGLAHDRRRHVA